MSNVNNHQKDGSDQNTNAAIVDLSRSWSSDIAHVWYCKSSLSGPTVPVPVRGDEAGDCSHPVQVEIDEPIVLSPGFVEDYPPLDDEYLRECLGEYPDFLYHIARNKYGGVYYRVVRSLLLDKGI